MIIFIKFIFVYDKQNSAFHSLFLKMCKIVYDKYLYNKFI